MTAESVDRVRDVVQEVVAHLFALVAEVHAAALLPRGDGPAGGPPVLGDDVRELLRRPGQLAVGLGLVVAPHPQRETPQRMQWWQIEPDGSALRALEPDLRPSSLAYYDYAATPWFQVPRRTGRRHVVGPYVDVHGTGQYLLTLTEPVWLDGAFVGVAGADVPVSAFETHLFQRLGRSAAFVLVNDEDRVVLSTSPRWLVGGLVPPTALHGRPERLVPGTPWRLLVLDEPTALRA